MDVHDLWAEPLEAMAEYGAEHLHAPETGAYDAIVAAVGPEQFREMGAQQIRKVDVSGTDDVVGSSDSDQRLPDE